MQTISIKTQQHNEFVDITRKISEIVAKSGVINGLAVIHVPHTTAGVTINENADPDVVHDILLTLDALIPHHRNGYLHCEGNSDAHVKSSLVGPSLTVIVNDGRLVLGTWQGIYFCEFDGPRNRHLLVKVQ